MNGDGEDVVVVVAQQERLIWKLYHRDDYLSISLAYSNLYRRFTISEVRDFIERHVERNHGTNDTIVSRLCIERHSIPVPPPPPTEQECALLGRSCQPLLAHHLQELEIDARQWTDSETSCILRHMSLPLSTVESLVLWGHEDMPMTIQTLCDESPVCLQTLRLIHVVLTSEDCQLLGQMISNKERVLDCLKLFFCSFPCLVDFVKLIAGFVKDKIPSDRCDFESCSVKDTSSIPTHHNGTDYLEFVRIFGVFWKWRDEESKNRSVHEPYIYPLDNSAHCLLNYFRRMQRAGLSRLLPPPSESSRNSDNACCDIETRRRQPRERWEWVKVLGHEAVIDRVHLLFHILLLNPEVCVLDR